MSVGININYAGWDSGYDACKLITNLMQTKDQSPLIFPSLAKETSSSMIDEQELGINKSISKEQMMIEVKDKNNEYYNYMIGDYVITQLESGGTNYEVNKYQSPEELAKLLAGLSVLHPKANKIIIDTLVTGLPVQHYKRHKERMSRRFRGSFEARVNNQQGEKATIEYEIKNVVVIPQAAGALMYNIAIEEQEDILDGRIGLLDVGGRTTDGLAYNKGQIIKDSPFSFNIGMSNVFRKINSDLNIDENIIREAIINNQDTVTYRQEEIGIKGLAEKYSEELANNIARNARNEWRDLIDLIDQILVVGGAGDKIQSYLKPAFDKIDIQVLPNSQIANVLGYLLRGQNIYNEKKTTKD